MQQRTNNNNNKYTLSSIKQNGIRTRSSLPGYTRNIYHSILSSASQIADHFSWHVASKLSAKATEIEFKFCGDLEQFFKET